MDKIPIWGERVSVRINTFNIYFFIILFYTYTYMNTYTHTCTHCSSIIFSPASLSYLLSSLSESLPITNKKIPPAFVLFFCLNRYYLTLYSMLTPIIYLKLCKFHSTCINTLHSFLFYINISITFFYLMSIPK